MHTELRVSTLVLFINIALTHLYEIVLHDIVRWVAVGLYKMVLLCSMKCSEPVHVNSCGDTRVERGIMRERGGTSCVGQRNMFVEGEKLCF